MQYSFAADDATTLAPKVDGTLFVVRSRFSRAGPVREALLRLEVGGTAHLFGGEAALAADVQQRFARLGLSTRLAIAPTAGAAWALSRYGPSSSSLGGRDVAALLAPLPVAALRLSPQAVRTLERLGLKTIAALAGIERRSLARRFREVDNPLDALDRALGRKPEPLTGTRVIQDLHSYISLHIHEARGLRARLYRALSRFCIRRATLTSW